MRAWSLSIALAVAMGCAARSTPPDPGSEGASNPPASDAGAAQATDGGSTPAPAECAGLLPAAVAEPTAAVSLDGTSWDNWGSSGTDGSGAVALSKTNDNFEPPFVLHVFDATGGERGAYQAVNTSLAERVFAQRLGFVVTGFDARTLGTYLAAIDQRGSAVATAAITGEYAGAVAGDPLGGVVLVLKRTGSDAMTAIAAYDERLQLRFRIPFASTRQPLALGVDSHGSSLLLLDGTSTYGPGSVAGIWIDHSGNARAEFRAIDDVATPPALFLIPRIGGGFFAGRNPGPAASASWVRQFDAFGAGSAPPDWLTARPGSTLLIARSGRAYAVPHSGLGDSSCQADIEVLAPSGASCGTAVLPTDASWCRPALVLGRDGTVVEGTAVDGPAGSSRRTSMFRWWTGLLK